MASSSGLLPSEPRTLPSTGFQVVDASETIEEETLPGYHLRKYYQYALERSLTKDTVLSGNLDMAQLLLDSRYVALKLYVANLNNTRELKAYECLDAADEKDHPGKTLIRKLLGSFQVDGHSSNGSSHLCLVHEPLGPSLEEILDLMPPYSFHLGFLKPVLRNILIAVDFLHARAGLIHTDLQITNFICDVRSGDETIFAKFENAEFTQPTRRKIISEEHIIYTSRRVSLSKALPLLCDFGEARLFSEAGTPGEDIMPNVYKAPEVIMQMEWDYKVDVWNVAMVVWHSLTGRPLFNGRSADGKIQDDRIHMAEMVALMGPPPLRFLERSTRMTRALWNEDGSWKNVAPIPDITLEKLGADINGYDKAGFFLFFRRMLRWLPEDRPTCEELVYDPWLMRELGLGLGR
ncbi:CMGC/SRPK protein kinase [[Emmonsia] crescens]|uniref:CMGC/SRPK protein kinase n=1 Tax=[Emmonsia] crescens TaxID=73230 RepID=A0A2B7Z5V9_9EURO|nr:CMGC/SRPK protein kinase [Emmonsia crescens]